MPYFGVATGPPRQPTKQPKSRVQQINPLPADAKLKKHKSKAVLQSTSSLDVSQSPRLAAAKSTPNLKKSRKQDALPALPPVLPPRRERRRPSQDAHVTTSPHVQQHLNHSRPVVGNAVSKPLFTVAHRHAVQPPACISTISSGYMQPDDHLTNEISDRMSTILTAIDEQELPPSYTEALLSDDVQQRHAPKHNRPKVGRFGKSWLYLNSCLPPALPPLKLYIPAWPLLCLCAQHSLAVYAPKSTSPNTTTGRPASINTMIPASSRTGAKAMSLTTHPLSTSNHIIIAVRGTASLADWAVNTWSTPASPVGFLADPGNLVHAGFLHVAKSMAAILAAKLRALLTAKSERRTASLVLTGHSAGGAVAALLYSHILTADPSLTSDLRTTAALFKRTHCVTFGAPPVSLLPLQKPPVASVDPAAHARIEKSMFFAFANEGDPVVRADPAIARSLLALYTAPAPTTPALWPVPPGAYSLAGRVILLRAAPATSQEPAQRRGGLGALLFKKGASAGPSAGYARDVHAFTVADDMLRAVVFGDPVMHSMRVYRERIEALAVSAVTGAS